MFMAKKIIKILFLAFGIILPSVLQAQNNCSADLKQAGDLYDKGMYQQAIDILSVKIKKCEYVDAERQYALKILISAYKEMDELEEADKLTYIFLNENPNYVIYTTDPQTFVEQIRRYKIRPKLTFGINLGTSFVKLNTTDVYSIWNAIPANNGYSTMFGYSFSVDAQWHFNNYFAVSSSAMYFSQQYERLFATHQYFTQTFRENITTFKIPVILNCSYQIGKNWYPTVYGGFYFSKLLSTTGYIQTLDKYYINGAITDHEDTQSGINLLKYRNIYNYGFTYGVALNYLLKRYTLKFCCSYSMDSKHYTNTEKIFMDEPLLVDYYYTDNEFKLRSLDFSFGVTYNLLYSVKSKY